ncbi:hypothetical protein B296_00050595 [Ensete ventricosum]|uniref:Uncharacterized protein n=1 Tax=Ensete ventricosum TaxID=4639 RepID=A0A426YKM7_ENSVE|nr:hypothetical protein B296_00050595 [Ensete ventricosum]
MDLYEQWKGILRIQKFRRMVSYAGFYCFVTLISYAYTSNTYCLSFPPSFLQSLLEPFDILFFSNRAERGQDSLMLTKYFMLFVLIWIWYKARFALPCGKAPYQAVRTGPLANRNAERPLPGDTYWSAS